MNSSNLINPFLPAQQRMWRRWCFISGFMMVVVIGSMVIFSAYLYWELHGLQKAMHRIKKNSAVDVAKKYAALQDEKTVLKQKMKRMRQRQQPVNYYDYITSLATTIPTTVVLTSLFLEQDVVLLKGQTQTIEGLLGFIHTLEQTSFFQSMNLVELQPSNNLYMEKKLVNFIIKGKLKGVVT